MEFLPFSNSSANQVSWNSSAALPVEEPYTDDGWSFREVKLFEKTLAEFRGAASLAFFVEAARRLHWRDMKSIMQHYEMLMTDLKLIEDGKVDDLVHMDEDGSSAHVEPKLPVMEKEQKKCTPWTPEEHRLFLMGLNEYGKGKWKKICQKYVTTKTPAQVASHAQKFFRRDFCKTPVAKRRRSINDIRFVTPVTAENLAQTYSRVVPPPPQVFPNNFYSVANGADETILGHQLIMAHPGINQQYI